MFIAAGIVTLVFAIIERTSAQIGAEVQMGPAEAAARATSGERKPSSLKAVCELGFGCFGLVWLLLVPHYPFLIFGPAAAFLKAAPLWHTFYVPIRFAEHARVGAICRHAGAPAVDVVSSFDPTVAVRSDPDPAELHHSGG